jgi:hypothetical protein
MSTATRIERHQPLSPAHGAFAALCSSALVTALIALALGAPPATPHDSIDPNAAAVASLVLHNAAVAMVPLALLALGWDQIPIVKNLADGLVAVVVIVNGAVVGYAFARAGPALLPYLPHLPFEWMAVAIPAGAWFSFRLQPPVNRRSSLLRAVVPTALALLIAALLEALATPLGA